VKTLFVLAAIHAMNDLVAGWILGALVSRSSAGDGLGALALYGAIAFAGQIVVAWQFERSRMGRHGMTIALAILCLALTVCSSAPIVAVALSGVASALVHVCGGVAALRLTDPERSFGAFSATGILGLTLGGWLGHHVGSPPPIVVAIPMVLLVAWVALDQVERSTGDRFERASPPDRRPTQATRTRTALVLLLLLALTARSAVWDVVQAVRADDVAALAWLALAAASGKVLGGFLCERRNSARFTAVVLFAAGSLLDAFGNHLAWACVGVALLQSTIPAAVVLLAGTFRVPASIAVALVLGVTVALGGLVTLFVPPGVVVQVLPLAGILLLWHSSTAETASSSGLSVDAANTSATLRF